MNPRRDTGLNDIEHQAAHFESIAKIYSEARSNAAHLAFKHVLWGTFFERNARFFSGCRPRVLEPMCGYGEGRDVICTHIGPPAGYSGFDISMEMVNSARRNHPGDDIFQQDITTYVPREEYDILIVIGGLHHVYRHSGRVLRLLRQALVPGGLFVSFEPTHNNLFARKVRQHIYSTNDFFDEHTEQGFALKDLNASFAAAGFSLIDQIYPGLLAYILYYNPDAFPRLLRGGPAVARILSTAESILWKCNIGRLLSFATLSLWRKHV